MRQTNAYSTTEGPSIGDLVSRLSQEASLLARQEVQLAKVEMKEKATQIGKDSALVIAGGVVALLGSMALTAFLILGLAEFMEAWLAALLVGVVLAIVALVLIQVGLNKLKETNPMPRQTMETMRENQEWLKQQV